MKIVESFWTSFKSKRAQDRAILKTVLILAGPIIIANLLQSAYYMIDAYWLGHVGKEAVATITTCQPLIMVLSALWIGLSVWCSTLVAQFYGAWKKDKISFIAAQTMALSFIAAIIVNIISFVFAPQVLTLMHVDPEIFDNAVKFIRIASIWMIFSFIYFNFQWIMRAIWKPQIPTYIQAGTVVLNFILAPFLVFWIGGILGWWVVWAAIVTVICQFVSCAVAIYLLLAWKFEIKLTLRDLKLDWQTLKKTIIISIPAGLEQSARNISMLLLMSIINTFGLVVAAAYWASFNVTQIALFSSMWFGIAVWIVVGQNLWAGHMDYAKQVAKTCASFAGIFFIIVSILLALFATQIITIFIPWEAETIVIWAQAVRIMAIGYTFMAINMVLANALISAWKTNITMTFTILTQLWIMLPTAYFLSKTSLWINWLWMAFPITNIINLILTFLYFSFSKWNERNLVKW